MKKEDYPLVSVIILTCNSGRIIKQCLESIKNQNYKNIEIIVVDRFSNDGTVEIAENYGTRIYQLDCERAEAKNFGLRNAKGKYVLFIDSDIELSKRVVEECVELAENPERLEDW